MKNKIQKLIAFLLLTLGISFVSLAQTHYKETVRTQGEDISIESLAINREPYDIENIKRTRILAKNGVEFAITFPESYQNLSIVRNDTNIVIEGRKIKVIGPGHLSFKFTYTENGVSYICDILGDVNYYGELRYQGTPLTSRNITITQSSDLSKGISADPKMAGVWWRVKVGSGYVDICEGTQTRTLQELLDFAKSKGVNGKAEFEVEFSDGTSNRFYIDGVLIEGSYSVQYFSIEDTRTYNLSLSQDGQGTVSVSKNQLKPGESATLTAQAAQGWRFDHWEENGQNLGTTNPLTVTMGAQDRSIKAVFTELPKVRVTLQIVDTNGQKLADPQYQDVTSGGSVTFQVPNLANVNFKGWKRNGQIVETGSSYTLSNVTQNETIQAVFEVPVQSVTVTPASITAKVGDGPVQLTATVLPSNATSKTVTWTSKNEQVVTVDSNGKVTIIGVGETTIEAKAEEKIFTVQVKIEAQPQQPQEPQVVPVQSITVIPASITAKVGEGPVQLTATVLPSDATSKTVTWTSKNEQVVKVDSTGKVTIIGVGETTIEAKAEEKIFTVQVKIEAQQPQVVPVQSVTVTPASITAKVGEGPVQLTATVLPSNATSKTVTWTSKNEQVVTVDSTGKVTIIGVGETTIEAQAEEKIFTVQVKIEAQPQQPQEPQVVPVQSVTVTPASITAKVGEGPVQLTATVLPSNATSKTVTWTSKNEQVVTVDSTGKVTIIGVGETTIEAKAEEKIFTVQVKIEAQPQQPQQPQVVPVQSVTVTPASITAKVGESKPLPSVTIIPTNATDQTITWTSDNLGIAKIENGRVVGVASGTATLEATSTNGKKAVLTVTVTTDESSEPSEQEALPPYIVSFPTEVALQEEVSLTPWQGLGSIPVEQIRYHLTDADGNPLSQAPGKIENQKLVFTQSGTYLLVAELPDNPQGWTRIEYLITVK